ncbi:type II toxin-antitoxin system PrlF family antitoxin [Candidatus Thiosymbion oneisti]|uniref:type II toxin-antitoxin system PrlF family antitoxin n=1 Tax=Candidatus Thiosymbion oneisti TaxID=589554 RepID=UPI001C406B50|nr:type II toxin-antitoxin system PrlF family antitoxin [Candidatus Thiosymbion oneisti]
MRTATSKLTKEYQATIPEPVRRLLHLEAGDAIAFDIEKSFRTTENAENTEIRKRPILCVLCGLNFTDWQLMPPFLRRPPTSVKPLIAKLTGAR